MKINLMATFMASMLIFSACGEKAPEEPPAIIVDAGGISVDNTAHLSSWNNTVYLIDGTAPEWLEVYSEPDYLPLGTIFRVSLPEKTAMPDSVSVTDTVIRQDGSMKYDERAAIKSVTPQISENVVTFSLDGHWASMLSSNTADYEPGAVWRCFEITCTWGEDVCIYTFCVRTDTGIMLEDSD